MEEVTQQNSEPPVIGNVQGSPNEVLCRMKHTELLHKEGVGLSSFQICDSVILKTIDLNVFKKYSDHPLIPASLLPNSVAFQRFHCIPKQENL